MIVVGILPVFDEGTRSADGRCWHKQCAADAEFTLVHRTRTGKSYRPFCRVHSLEWIELLGEVWTSTVSDGTLHLIPPFNEPTDAWREIAAYCQLKADARNASNG